MRILVADDDPVYCSLLEDILEEWGYEAEIVDNGAKAWEFFQAPDQPELALFDWSMPEIDGFELCRRIRQDIGNQSVHIILMTGSHEKKEVIKVLVAGADDYLMKPFQPLDLQIRLRVARKILSLQVEVASLRATQDVPVEISR